MPLPANWTDGGTPFRGINAINVAPVAVQAADYMASADAGFVT